MSGVILDILYAILRAPAGGSSPLSLDRSQDAWPWIRWHRIVGLRVFLGKHIVSPPHASILARKLKHIDFVDFLEAFVDYHQRKYWSTLWCWVCASDCLCPQLRSNHVLTMDGPSALKVACGALQGALLDKQETIPRPIPVLGSFLTTSYVRTTEDL